MNRALLRKVTDEDIATYQRDGVICIRQQFDGDWITALTAGLAHNMTALGTYSRVYNRDDAGHTFFYDANNWQQIPEYRAFVLDSPCGELAGRLMQANKVNFFHETVFIRSAGTAFRTPWHQDEPYWSIEGFDTCSFWMPLVPVARKSSLEFVRGSHRTGKRYRRYNFGDLNPVRAKVAAFRDEDDVEDFPDIDANPSAFDILGWELEPGDCLAFNARTIHGGSGNLDTGRDLCVFSSRWLGDDVRVCFREGGMEPDYSALMTAEGLKPGDPMDCERYPVVWRAQGV
jgi:ectoine hydroxylase-related dioxygenase (phytanoyl-CoA dioxygenase family)